MKTSVVYDSRIDWFARETPGVPTLKVSERVERAEQLREVLTATIGATTSRKGNPRHANLSVRAHERLSHDCGEICAAYHTLASAAENTIAEMKAAPVHSQDRLCDDAIDLLLTIVRLRLRNNMIYKSAGRTDSGDHVSPVKAALRDVHSLRSLRQSNKLRNFKPSFIIAGSARRLRAKPRRTRLLGRVIASKFCKAPLR